ncbi:MAG: hypothetical protein RR506_08850 [Akkermansia sp.]
MNQVIYREKAKIAFTLIIGVLFALCSSIALAQTQKIADQLIQSCSQNGIKTIVVSKLFHNGGTSDQLTNGIRGDLLEKLVNSDTGINVIDATNENLSEKEKTLQLSTKSTTPTDNNLTDAILVGDVLTSPEIPEGICQLRLVSFRNKRIIAAPIVRFSLTDNGQDQKRKMPCVQGLEKLNMKNLRGRHIALSDLGNLKEDNTIENRLAYSEVIAAMVRSGILLYEREFFYLTIDEVKKRGSELTPGDTDAIMSIRSRPDGAIDVSVSEQDSSILFFRSVLSFDSSKMSDKNDTETQEQARNTGKSSFFQIEGTKYSSTVRISKNMSIDDKEVDIWLSGQHSLLSIEDIRPLENNDTRNWSYTKYDFFSPERGRTYIYDGEAQLKKYIQVISLRTKKNEKAIRLLTLHALLYGFFVDEGHSKKDAFPGIYFPLTCKIYNEWTTNSNGESKFFLTSFPEDLLAYIWNPYKTNSRCNGYPKGIYECCDVKINYEIIIKWENNIPSEITLTIDINPMKDKLFHVINKVKTINI